jgi:hypothetical protein
MTLAICPVGLLILLLMSPYSIHLFVLSRLRRHHKDFKSATSGVHTKTMRNEINRLVNTVPDPLAKKVRIPTVLCCAE